MKTHKHRPLSCIYMIESTEGAYYIGKTDDAWRRWEEHYTALKFGDYTDGDDASDGAFLGKDLMQHHWNENGKHTFSFKVLCERSNMALIGELETHLIKLFQPEYNSVHRDKDAEQLPFYIKAVELFLSSWLPIPLREMPKNKAFNLAATWKRLKDIQTLERNIATQTGLRQMLNDFYPDMFTLSNGSITRIKDYEGASSL